MYHQDEGRLSFLDAHYVVDGHCFVSVMSLQTLFMQDISGKKEYGCSRNGLEAIDTYRVTDQPNLLTTKTDPNWLEI